MDYTRKASIQRKTLWQQIADVLREDIIRGKIKPGERIVEEDIAEKFHVSRGPVREALRHIGEEGFVVIIRICSWPSRRCEAVRGLCGRRFRRDTRHKAF